MDRMNRRIISAMACCAAAGLCHTAAAQPQANIPLDPPLFSLRAGSPTLSIAIRPDDVLAVGPFVVFNNTGLGLGMPGDELDGLSGNRGEDISAGDCFAFLFSVDRMSFGAAPPDPALVPLGYYYNVADQAFRHQQAGDVFMTLDLFNCSTGFEPSVFNNNILVINQGDAGGVDLTLDPDDSPSEKEAPADPIDQVDAMKEEESGAIGFGVPIGTLFFSMRNGSPSLASLPINSGGAIFFDPNPFAAGTEQLYVGPGNLGLLPMDDIDAFIVFDNGDFVFTPGTDRVMFSLSRDSPSLGIAFSAADIFVSNGAGSFLVFAGAIESGLDFFDNITALELLPADDGVVAAIDHGIFALRGDMNCDTVVDALDVPGFVAVLLNPAQYALLHPDCDIRLGDMNGDGAIDGDDIQVFVDVLLGT
jgi:hypothetical protein